MQQTHLVSSNKMSSNAEPGANNDPDDGTVGPWGCMAA